MTTPYWQSADGKLTLYNDDSLTILPELTEATVCVADEPNVNEFPDWDWGWGGWTSLLSTDKLHVLIKPHAMTMWLAQCEFTLAGVNIWQRPDRDWDALLHFTTMPSLGVIVDDDPRETNFSFERGAIQWQRLMEGVYQSGDIFIDPFSGSGTTLKVAQRMGVSAIGVERNESLCQAIVERLES